MNYPQLNTFYLSFFGRFIGELFKVEMFPPNILSRCIRRLSSESKSEESLECLCILLTTVGEEIEYRKKFKVKKATSVGIRKKKLLTVYIFLTLFLLIRTCRT